MIYEDKPESTLRAEGEGWVLAGMNDPSGRRGLWYRESREGARLEVCAGREGDDRYVQLNLGEKITRELLDSLAQCLYEGRWEP